MTLRTSILLGSISFHFTFFAPIVGQQSYMEQANMWIAKNLIFFYLAVNDSDTLTFMFDSAAGVTVLDEEAASRLDLRITDTATIGTAGKSVQALSSKPNVIQISELELPDVELQIFDISHLSEHFNFRIDGVIGYDLLKSFAMETNPDEMTLTFYDPNLYQYNGAGVGIKIINMESNHFGIPLTFIPRNHKSAVTIPVKWDTGCGDYLVFHQPVVQKLGMLEKRKFKPVRGFGAEATVTKNYRSKVKSVALGGKEWKNVPVVLEVDPVSIQARRNTQAEGFIGQQLLNDFIIVYHLLNQMIYLEER